MTRIYLLRHGATTANREVPYRLQGRGSDRPLDETGLRQADAAGRVLASIKLNGLYSSPLLRALQTARSLGSHHGRIPIPIPGLIEGDIGRWEGLTWDEAAVRDPDHHARFMTNPGTVPYPDGESFLDVQRRASIAIAELAAAHRGETIAIVGHNILNRAYLSPLLGLPIDRARGIRQSNCGINVIEVEPEGGSVLITLNSALHLDGL
ncbi:MAG: Phosphoglycerate mutase [Planctomycetota bacterium]|nr:Phosphoglycerate mutase [Planctomycetota bacterium]